MAMPARSGSRKEDTVRLLGFRGACGYDRDRCECQHIREHIGQKEWKNHREAQRVSETLRRIGYAARVVKCAGYYHIGFE